MRVGGSDGLARRIEILGPFTDEVDSIFELRCGAVATSGIGRRLWSYDGDVGHHLVDPRRGTAAWTGLVQATAVAPTALEAEVLAKAALLSGPACASRWLERWGGVVFDDRGERRTIGPLVAEPVSLRSLDAA
jgi:thiamine biosynthesis lipoprotein